MNSKETRNWFSFFINPCSCNKVIGGVAFISSDDTSITGLIDSLLYSLTAANRGISSIAAVCLLILSLLDVTKEKENWNNS